MIVHLFGNKDLSVCLRLQQDKEKVV